MKRASLIFLLAISGCSWGVEVAPPLTPSDIPVRYVDVPENPIPGTVEHVWDEPMVNTIRVPARVDPSDTYYMPSHEAVVEIYPGRYQPVQYPGDREKQGGK